ncbi:hypothetical protein HDR63_03000 [bacterium]|nr:hypothetical protein [bacterium]
MSLTIVRKTDDYSLLPKSIAEKRNVYNKIRQKIRTFPHGIVQILEKDNPLGNDYDAAYCLQSDIKLIVAQHSHVHPIALAPGFINPTITGYECYVVMPDGQSVNLSDTKYAKLLFDTARQKATIEINTGLYNAIEDHIKAFKKQYNVR